MIISLKFSKKSMPKWYWKKSPETLLRFKLVRFCAWIIKAAQLTSETFSHTSPSKKSVCDFPYALWFFFYNLLKFDIINVDVRFCKRGHNLETEVKLNKSWHPFSNEVSLNVGADFQLNPSKDTHKRTKNVHPYMQFYFIEKKTKNVSWDFYD